MQDLRESGAIEQDADVVVCLYRDNYYENESINDLHTAEAIIRKNRNGATGIASLLFNPEIIRFENNNIDIQHEQEHNDDDHFNLRQILKELSEQIHKHLQLKGNPAPLNTNSFYEWHQHTRLAEIKAPSETSISHLKECLRYRLHQIDHLKDALPYITEADTLQQIIQKLDEVCTHAEIQTRKKLAESLLLTRALGEVSLYLSVTHSNFHNFQDSIQMIDKLWRQCKNHGATIKHPIAPLVEAWLLEQNAHHITQEKDRRHPTGLLPKLTLGSVRDVVLEYDGPGQLPTDPSASLPQVEQLDMWEPEPDSVLGPVLVWHQPLVHPITLETPTTRRGAVSHAVRTIEEVFCALTPDEFKSGMATIKIDLEVLLYARHPDWHRERSHAIVRNIFAPYSNL